MKISFEEITINEIEEFYKMIQEELNSLSEKKLVLDFENVEQIDLITIQILISLKKYCNDKQIELEFLNMSSRNILESIEVYNLQKHLELDNVN